MRLRSPRKLTLVSVCALSALTLVGPSVSRPASFLRVQAENAPSENAAPGDDLPGKVVHSWLANSFATEEGHQSVPINVSGIGVAPDGTVFSAGVAEALGGVASYKSGRFVTKYDYDSGWGSSLLSPQTIITLTSGRARACSARVGAMQLITERLISKRT